MGRGGSRWIEVGEVMRCEVEEAVEVEEVVDKVGRGDRGG